MSAESAEETTGHVGSDASSSSEPSRKTSLQDAGRSSRAGNFNLIR